MMPRSVAEVHELGLHLFPRVNCVRCYPDPEAQRAAQAAQRRRREAEAQLVC